MPSGIIAQFTQKIQHPSNNGLPDVRLAEKRYSFSVREATTGASIIDMELQVVVSQQLISVLMGD